MLWDVAKQLSAKLIELTKQDKIRWNENLDIQYAEYNGNKIFVGWPQDGKPGLTFNDTQIDEYGLGIEELLAEIHKQYERQDRNGYGPTGKKERQESNQKSQEKTQKEAADFANAANKFLDNENNKNKKRR